MVPKLTVAVLADVVVGRVRWLTAARLVVRAHAELVHLLLLEALDNALTVVVLGLGDLHPVVGVLVLDLDGVVRDGAAAVALGLGPAQRHALVVPVVDLGLAGLAGLVCNGAYIVRDLHASMPVGPTPCTSRATEGLN